MAFRFVETNYEGQIHSHSDGDWYEFGPSGILAVHSAAATRDAEFYAPQASKTLLTRA